MQVWHTVPRFLCLTVLSELKNSLLHYNMDGIEIIAFITGIVLLVLTGNLASKYGRSVIGWIIFGMFLSPLLSLVFLLCIGETTEIRIQKYEEFAKIFWKTWDNNHKPQNNDTDKKYDLNNPPISINDMYNAKTQKVGTTINDLYRK